MNGSDPFRLEGKAVMVTGASRGIGAAISLAMADAGADVGLVARNQPELEELASRIRSRGRRASVMVDDLRVTRDVGSLIDQMVSELGSLDVLVNNAGGAAPAPFVQTTASQLDDAFHFNVTTAFEIGQGRGATPSRTGRRQRRERQLEHGPSRATRSARLRHGQGCAFAPDRACSRPTWRLESE